MGAISNLFTKPGTCPKCGAESKFPLTGAFCFMRGCQGTVIPPTGRSPFAPRARVVVEMKKHDYSKEWH
jgi:hypothetical protein